MIWLLRHGDAVQGSPDSERPLTDKGREQSRAAGAALKGLGVKLDACLTSPKLRALDTAKIACEQLDGVEPQPAEELAGGDFDTAALVAGLGDEVMLVGHEPDFSNAIRSLTGARVDLKKGGLAGVDGSALIVLMRPRELKRIDS
jgi:phosphohistidine phosphatase